MTRVYFEGQKSSTLCGIDEVHMDLIPMRGNAKILPVPRLGVVYSSMGVFCSNMIK